MLDKFNIPASFFVTGVDALLHPDMVAAIRKSGRHEIGVELQVHTPPFGGTATIHLWFVSFDISFGDPLPPTPKPPLYEFITTQVGVLAAPSGSGDYYGY